MEPHAASYSMNTAAFFQGVNPPRREIGHSYPCDAKIKTAWKYCPFTLSSTSCPSLMPKTNYFTTCISPYACRCSIPYKP